MSLQGATIAFDLDGTLVETAPDLIGALNTVLGESGLAGLPVEAARVLVGRGARALIERGFAAVGAPLDPERTEVLVARFIAVYRERIAAESHAFDGLEACLDALHGAGGRLVVCTNKRTDLSIALLDALGLTRRFAAVVGADRSPAPKPDPRHFLAAVEAAGGDPARALMVGDSLADVLAAKGAGAPVVVVSFGYTDTAPAELGADAVIDHFSQLFALATALLSGRAASAIGSPSLTADA